MRFVFLTMIVTLFASGAHAQDSTLRARAEKLLPRHAIKHSPLHLLSFYATVQMSYEFRISPTWTIQADGGVIVDTQNLQDFERPRGYKAKLEPRHYFAFSEKRSIGFYQGYELYRNDVSFSRSTTVTECFDPECSARYRRTYRYRMNYLEHGLAPKLGMVKYFRPFLMDIAAGIAFRVIDYSAPPYIDIRELDNGVFEVPRIQDRMAFAPIVNFRIGYFIR